MKARSLGLIEVLYGWQQRTRQRIAAQMYRRRHREGEVSPSPIRRKDDFQRILLVIAGLIGDTVMSVPVIIEARRLWPTAKITVLGQKHNCELLSSCPLIDRCVPISVFPFSITKTRQLKRLQRWLQGEEFDVALLVLGDQFALMAAKAGIPVRVGVQQSPLAPCLTHTYTIGTPQSWGPAERLNALRCLGFDVREVSPRLWISRDARVTSRRKIADLGLSSDQDYAVVHPFGSTRRQWWPAESVERLAARLGEDLDLKTLVVGGAETRSYVPNKGATNVINGAGLFSLSELSAILETSAVIVSTDSGPLHIAGALGRPVIGLFRERRAEHAARYPGLKAVIGANHACQSQCKWDHCARVPCRQVSGISAEEVLSAAREIVTTSVYA